MISCLLIRVTHDQRGLPASSKVRIAGESIEIGRGTACQIHLPDPRVGLLHATVRRSEDGALWIRSADDALISINGCAEQVAMLGPGMRIGIGPYLITVGPATADVDLSLSVGMPESLADGLSVNGAAPLTLSDLGLSTRKLGLGLAALILLAFLVLPMLPRLSATFDVWQAKLPVTLTESLSPGALSTGHGVFGQQCSACHEQAFQAVTDSACSKCHEQTALHLAADDVHEGAFRDLRCADCHPAHQGKMNAMGSGMAQCVNCHRKQDTSVANFKDFGSAHPGFQLTLPVGGELKRFRQNENKTPPEESGLKFSHKAHLVKNGISTPEGITVLTCRSCHKLEESGIHFAPMKMEMTCQQSRCHKLRATEPVAGAIPHGSEREAMNKLRNFYTNWLADAPANMKECGTLEKTGNIVKRTLDCADMLARKHAAATLFRSTGEKLQCPLCHEITETDRKDVPWKVTPPRLNRDWQPRATFTHAKHETMNCADCHDKANSQSSEDHSFPRIEKCRECHTGMNSQAGKIKSNCESCHRFHRIAKNPP